VPARSAIPDTALAAVRKYCDGKVPAPHRDEVRVEYDVRGKNVTVFECRPPWQPTLGAEWTRQPVAQLRYNSDDHDWRLYC
jgi:hypothetical protein